MTDFRKYAYRGTSTFLAETEKAKAYIRDKLAIRYTQPWLSCKTEEEDELTRELEQDGLTVS